MGEFSIGLDVLIKEFSLETLYMPCAAEEIKIKVSEINRSGLQLTGFTKYTNRDRIQLIGKVESSYLADLTREERIEKLGIFFALEYPAIIITRDMDLVPEFMEIARKHSTAVLRTPTPTSEFMAELIASLNVHLAPRVTIHGVLVEVYGEGVLLIGDSGIGKSETAIELVKRGHRLIADDAVEIKRVSAKTLVGSSPENIRYYIELRGIGIVDVRRLFGMGSVKISEKIDMVIQLERWDNKKVYDRMGLESDTTNILGLDITSLTIPVHPGRNLAVVIEAAAMNNRQKKMGFNAAKELNDKLMEQFKK